METKPLKPAKFWYLVAVNYVSSFVGAGLLVIVISAALGFFGPSSFILSDDLTGSIALTVIYLLALWLMTWNTARYLRKTYMIPDPRKVVLWTVYVAVALLIVSFAWEFIANGGLSDMFHPIFAVIEIGAFYVLSKKYLRG